MSIIVSGFTPNTKTPGFYGRQIFATGSSTASLFSKIVLIVGLGSTAATAVPDTDINIINSDEDANLYAGEGSEGALMCQAALLTPGAVVRYLRPTDPSSSPAYATATVTVSGTWSTIGTWTLRLGGRTLSGGIAVGDVLANVATNIAAVINKQPNFPFTASPSAGVVTITCKSIGARGNYWRLFKDNSQLPSGAAIAIAGGTAVNGGGVPFTGGVGTETVTAAITTMSTSQFDLIASGANDATNLGLYKTFVDGQASPTIGFMNNLVFATSGTTSAAKSLSTSTLNDPAFTNLYLANSEQHPSVLAASVASDMSVTESSNPNPRYMNEQILGAVAQGSKLDWMTTSVSDDLLNNGVSPCKTLVDGTVVVSRLITTYCLTALGAQDDRVLDRAEKSMSDYARMRLGQMWNGTLSDQYTNVQDNPPAEGPDPASNVLFPSLLASIIVTEQKQWERNGWQAVGSTAAYPPVIVYNPSGRNLLGNVTVTPTPGNYQLGANIRQRATL